MKLCDECITKLGNNLSQQAQQVLDQLAIILEDKGLTGMGFEQATEMNRAAVKDIIDELEDNLLLDHTIQDRRKVFYLTDSGQRFLELQQEPTDSEPDQEELVAKEEEKTDTSEVEVNNQGEQDDSSQNNTQESSAEKENREEENRKEIKIPEEELDNGVDQQEERQQEQKKEQDSEPLVWDFDF